MDWIIIAGMPPYDGRYELALEDVTVRELGWIKRLADTLPAGLWPGLEGGDAEVVCVLAVIALRRAGKVETADVPAVYDRLQDGPYGSMITVEVGDDQAADEGDADPTESVPVNGGSSGAGSTTSSENPETGPKPSGIPGLAGSESDRPTSATSPLHK